MAVREGGEMAIFGGHYTGVAGRHPQTAYEGLQKSLHQEWNFMQHVTPGIGTVFQIVEDQMHEVFLPAILKGATSHIPGRAVTGMQVNQDGITLPDPNQSAGAN